LGLIFYQHPKYQDLEKAYFHISKAVKINPLQEQMWFILGCISLNVGKWDSAINGFRRSTNLNWDNFQAWGNLAAAHLQKGEKYKAFCTYQEAIKCEYDKPKLWENFLLVSIDCGKFIEAIQAYHRLIDLKKRWTDVPVLNVLVDNYEKFSIPKKKILELLGRVTSSDPKEAGSWIAYGRAIGLENDDKARKDMAIDCYIKAFRCKQQSSTFPTDTSELETTYSWLTTLKPVADPSRLQTSIAALKSTCETLCTTHQESSEMYSLASKILSSI